MSKSENKVATTNANAGAVSVTDFGEYSGAGFENQTSQDLAIPFLGLIQDLSPQTKKKNEEKYIPGAEPGMFFNTVTNDLMPDTVHIVPCYTEHVFVEWKPRDQGGGFVGTHGINAKVVVDAKSRAVKFNELFTEEGNEIDETFYIYALLLDSADAESSVSPIVIACNSSKIKPYKQLMTKLRTIKGRPPLFAFRLAVTAIDAVNNANQPYSNLAFAYANGEMESSLNLPGNGHAGLLAEGMELSNAIKGGSAKADHGSQNAGSDGDEPF